MTTNLNPYLSFRDDARAAMEFYQSVLGGTLTVSTFSEYGMNEDPGEADKVMHSQLEVDGRILLMGADTPKSMDHSPGGPHSISLSGDEEDVLRGYWDRLSEGGVVIMPLEQAPWGDAFGMCVDRFGVRWMVNIAGPGARA